jgi:AcrR family transcriptional regulator
MTKKPSIGKRRVAAAAESSPLYLQRKQAIFAAATKVFLQRGYEAATLAQIAEELDFPRATLYYYASSKQELFHLMVKEAAENNLATIEKVVKQDCSATEKLYSALQGLMKSYSSMFPFVPIFLQHFLQMIPSENEDWSVQSRDWGKRFYNAIHDILQQGVDADEFTLAVPVGVATMGVIGMVNWAQVTGKPHRRRKSYGDLTPEEIGSGFADILLSGFARSSKPGVKQLEQPAPKLKVKSKSIRLSAR